MDKGQGADQVTRLGKGWKSQAGCKYDQQPARWKPFDLSLKGSIAIFALFKCRWVWVFPAGWFSDWLARLLPGAGIAQSAHLKFCLNLSQLPPRQHLDVGAHLEMHGEFSINTFSPTKTDTILGIKYNFEKVFFSSSHLANTVAIVGCKYKYCLMGTCLRVLVLPVLSLMYRAINSFRPEGWMSKFSYSTESWILQLLPRTEEARN